MWWIMIQKDWYTYQGNLDYLKEQRSYLLPLLEQLIGRIKATGEENLDGNQILDWPSSRNKKALHAGMQSLMIMTMKAGADLCGYLNEPAMQKKCLDAQMLLQKHIPDPNGSKQATAAMILAGLASAENMNREILSKDPSSGISPFFGYYILKARAKAGDYKGALDCIREYWGAMLDLGATTFWENFTIENVKDAGRIDQLIPPGKKDIIGDYGDYCYIGFRHSLCHGWASGPTAWLSEYVLGISVLEPGCKTVQIEPHLGDLQWAEGTFPTPVGVIHVRHDKNAEGKIKTTYTAPKGVKIVLK
jgi:alpha-L-rhamnosidase